jgi:hypothetical protein
MSSERLTILALALATAVGCADLERGPAPVPPDAGPDTASADGGGLAFASVRPLLDDGCRGCHSAGQMAGNTGFLLTGEAAAEYTAVRAFLDPSMPGRSRLLAKASGQGHGGGAIYRAASAEYAALLAWISGGANP